MNANPPGQGMAANKSPPDPGNRAPDARTASQWLTDALNEARRHTNDHKHVEWLIKQQSAGKIAIDITN